MNVHRELNWGLLEAVYQEALQLELKNSFGVESQREQEIEVFYKGTMLEKKYKMDLVVDDIIIETKSVSHLRPEHRAQLCNYLRLTKKSIGLLINFGEQSLIGERWTFDIDTNECFLVDRNMNRVFDIDYDELFDYKEQ